MELEHVVSESSTGSIFHRGPQCPLVLHLEMDQRSPSRFQTVIGLGLVVDEATHVASSYAHLLVVWHASQAAGGTKQNGHEHEYCPQMVVFCFWFSASCSIWT